MDNPFKDTFGNRIVFAMGYKKGRAEAIEEIFNLIDDDDAQCEFCPVSGLERPDCLGVSCLPAIIKFLESLKEQK